MNAKLYPARFRLGATIAGVLLTTLGFNIYRTQYSEAARLASDGCQKQLNATRFIRTELFFGLSKPNGAIVTAAEFQSFVDAEVTPRFPDGLTLMTGAGQFKSTTGAIRREPSKVLVLLHPEGSDQSRAIEQIRTAYRQQFQQESVLRSDDATCVSF